MEPTAGLTLWQTIMLAMAMWAWIFLLIETARHPRFQTTGIIAAIGVGSFGWLISADTAPYWIFLLGAAALGAIIDALIKVAR